LITESEVLCEVCEENFAHFLGHYEEHVDPPRELDVCNGCHIRIHRLGKKSLGSGRKNIWVYGVDTIITKVQKARRVVIPKVVCDLLKINEGDTVRIKIAKEEGK